MIDAKEQVKALLADSEKLTVATCVYGELLARLKPHWYAWTTRVRNLLTSLYNPTSPVFELVTRGLGTEIDTDEDFYTAKSYFIDALKLALHTLQDDTFHELRTAGTTAPGTYGNKIFVVHGHDEAATNQLESFLKELGLEPIVLLRQPDKGRTVIEKFEQHSDVGYALVLLTPDEIAYLASEDEKPDEERTKEKRARPNVMLELGYFIGRLKRDRVCCILKDGVEMPSDLHGLVYKPYRDQIKEAFYDIQKELIEAKYDLKLNP